MGRHPEGTPRTPSTIDRGVIAFLYHRAHQDGVAGTRRSLAGDMIRSAHHRLVRLLLGALLPLALLLAQSAALTHELTHLLRSAPDRTLVRDGVAEASPARARASVDSARSTATVSDAGISNSGRTGVPLSGGICEACLVFAHMAGAIGMDAPDWQASPLAEATAIETPTADTPTDLPLRRGRDPPTAPAA